MDYVKIDNGSLRRLNRLPHVSNPTAETLAAYAAAHGYKALQTAASPGRYHTSSYEDTGAAVSQVWTPLQLETARSRALEEVQLSLNRALACRVSLPCPLGFPIIYDQDALINAAGMSATGYCAAFIDANDTTHTLDAAEVQTVTHTLEKHRTGLYATAQQARIDILQAGSTEEVEAILNELSL